MTLKQTSAGSGVSIFGKHYAVLNLDLMTVLIDAAKGTDAGKAFISNCSRWNDAVHAKDIRPLTIFTSLCFSTGAPELAKNAPFTRLLEGFSSFEAGSPAVGISPYFVVDEKDIVLQKTRWYAGSGNALEQILRAQHINTVVISGLSLSGVVMSTIFRLFDLDYNIYVISNNVLELPPDQHPEVSKTILGTLLPKMNLRVISIEEALEALDRC